MDSPGLRDVDNVEPMPTSAACLALTRTWNVEHASHNRIKMPTTSAQRSFKFTILFSASSTGLLNVALIFSSFDEALFAPMFIGCLERTLENSCNNLAWSRSAGDRGVLPTKSSAI